MKRTPEEVEQADREITRLWLLDQTIPAIADALGLSHSVVSTRITILRRRGVDMPYRDNAARKVPTVRFPTKEERDARPLNVREISEAVGARL